MIDKIQFLPDERQRMVRLMALSMQGPTQHSSLLPLAAIGAIISALAAIFH